jgi:hypothetical protein
MRHVASALPRKTPWRSSASSAYWLQVGLKRQVAGFHGEIQRR